MKLKVIGIISAVLSIYALIHIYIGWHLLVFIDELLHVRAPVIIGCFVGLLAISYLIARMARRWLPRGAAAALKVLGAYWMAVMMYLVLLLPIADGIAALLSLTGAADASTYVPILGIVVGAVILLLLLLGSWNAWRPVIRQHQIVVEKQVDPAGRSPVARTDQLRIAVASDLHLGTIVGNRHIDRLVEQMEQIEPDLILLVGDVVDDEIEPFIKHGMADRLAQLRAPLGVYAVLGNHEYYGGGMARYLEEMERIGIRVLLDETVKLDDRFYIAGRKDLTAESTRGPGASGAGAGGGGRLTVQALLSDVDPRYPIILMDHQPQQLGQAEEAGVDISLSGHTHRGQLSPNQWITRRLFELDWGYLRKGNMHAFVSSGFGTWGPPVRTGSRSEVLQIDVRFGRLS